MAPLESALTTTHDVKSVHSLDANQVTRASKALLKHIKEQQNGKGSTKKNLLQADDSDEDEAEGGDQVPIWLILSTKKHIVDKKRLKPTKIPLPHPILASPTSSICLISADPQRTYKDLLTTPGFPTELASRIKRVIGLSKLKAKYKSYEARRQLRAEYDLFLADERIITSLPAILGKDFYKSTSKRPIPIKLTGNERFDKDENGRKVKPQHSEAKGGRLVGTPATVAREIERALGMALVNLSPSTTTAIQVGRGNFEPQHVADNVAKVVDDMTQRIIPQGWRNLRAVHIKGPETMAVPIWLANELWVDEADVIEEGEGGEAEDQSKKRKRKDGEKDGKGSKKEKVEADEGKQEEKARKDKIKKAKAKALSNDDGLAVAAA